MKYAMVLPMPKDWALIVHPDIFDLDEVDDYTSMAGALADAFESRRSQLGNVDCLLSEPVTIKVENQPDVSLLVEMGSLKAIWALPASHVDIFSETIRSTYKRVLIGLCNFRSKFNPELN